MGITLTTNGLVAADDFPAALYNAINERVAGAWGGHEFYDHFAGAWGAVAYRFHAAVDAGEVFQKSLISSGSSPGPDERYRQDTALAEFYGGGFSAFESVFYALHAIGVFLDPASFSLATPKAQQKVSPSQTSEAFRKTFPGDPILAALDAALADAPFQEWREIRNVLTHRTAPGRRMYVGVGMDDAPPTEWKLKDIALDESMVPDRLRKLGQMFTPLVGAIDVFVAGRT